MTGGAALATARDDQAGPELRAGPARFLADPSGVLWWPEEHTLFVADLHLEKGTSFARAGVLLPPFDTAATLARLAEAVFRLAPARIVALGDSFHDAEGMARLDDRDRAKLAGIAAGRHWIWLGGNHDPASLTALDIGGVSFVHEAGPERHPEVSGHFHPKASLRIHGRAVSCRCFVGDGTRLILPAFGAYAGGLDVREPAIAGLFPDGFTAHLLGRRRITAVPSTMLGLAV